MALPGQVKSASPGLLGFDANTVISFETAQRFFQDGYKFCVRYVSRGQEPQTDLTPKEATDILNAGLALMPVQHVRAAGWIPSRSLGMQDGTAAAKNTKDVGFPQGVNVWLDLEGVSNSVSAEVVIDYCNAWFQEVSQAGYIPGIYVGSAAILTGQQLYSDLSFQHYWRSQSNVPNIAQRGYQLIQLFPTVTINGIEIDIDVTQNDFFGGQVQWLVSN